MLWYSIVCWAIDTIFLLTFDCASNSKQLPAVVGIRAYSRLSVVFGKCMEPCLAPLRVAHGPTRCQSLLSGQLLYKLHALSCVPCSATQITVATSMTLRVGSTAEQTFNAVERVQASTY
jgi:hypothetical protein